jgi:HSP20 family protein
MYMRSVWSPSRSSPISDFLSVQRALRQSMLEDAFQSPTGLEDRPPTMKVRLDVREDDKAFHVVADLPGVSDKDVDVTFDEGVLTIKGEKKTLTSPSETEEKLHVSERVSGSFARQIALGSLIDPSKIEASFDKGVLTVDLYKIAEEPSKARKIEIKVS